jgi:hypothetical protein
MVKFTKEVIEMAKMRFEPLEIEMSEVKDRLTQVYEQPFMSQFTDETERQMASLKIVMAQVIASTEKVFANSETILMRIESKDEVTPFKRQDGTESYRSNLYVTLLYEDEPKFGQVTLWGDANDMQPSLTIGKLYLIPAVINGRDPFSLSVNDAVDVDIVKDETLPTLAEVIKNDFTPIEIREMESNISRDWNDLKLVKGTVTGSWMKVTKNDKNMGFLKIVGDDTEEITVVKFSRNADQVTMYGIGSMVFVLGQVTDAVLGTDGLEMYPVGMWGNLIISMLVIPPEMKDTPGIEASETPIQKSDGSEGGFNKDAVEGW